MSGDGTVKVGRTRIAIPSGIRQDFAEELAERLNKRLAQIEEESQRIDTQGFALQLAFEYALRMHQLSEERQQESAEVARALQQLNEELERLLAPRPEQPDPAKTTPFRKPTG